MTMSCPNTPRRFFNLLPGKHKWYATITTTAVPEYWRVWWTCFECGVSGERRLYTAVELQRMGLWNSEIKKPRGLT